MRRLVLLITGLGIFLLGLLPATTAHADSDDDSITKYTVTADVAKDGTTTVRLAFDFDFGSDEGRGPYLTFPLRQAIENDPDQWRMLDVTLGEVTSPSGANNEVSQETDDGNLLVRIGNENKFFTGTQSYVVTYTIRGLIAPNQATSGLDEFNWNVIGGDWEIPISNITATVTGPVDVTKAACFVDGDTSRPCASETSGDTATFTQSRLSDHTSMHIVAGFPGNTFVGAEARFEKRFWIGNMFPVNAATGSVTAVLTALGLGALLRRTRRGSRDEVYLGLTPGVTPAKGQQVAVGRGAADAPVAVQFTPAAGARPGEVGVLTDSTADNVDLTATIIDLAVRKHLTVEQQNKKDWTFTRLNNPEKLSGYEAYLVKKLFQNGPVVTSDDLKDSDYAGLFEKTREKLYKRVTEELHWFTHNPSLVRGGAIVGGIALTLAGGALGLVLGFVGWGLVGLAGVICGLAMLALNNRFGARTAEGSAMLAQTKGFELYLTTAEADQIKFEEGIDVFSRYLPYAIVFGVADRWAKLFEQLAAQGAYTADTSWYVGYGYGYGMSFGNLTSSMDSLASTMSSSMQSATAASSGGSGFSGGGGFGGGGGGGW